MSPEIPKRPIIKPEPNPEQVTEINDKKELPKNEDPFKGIESTTPEPTVSRPIDDDLKDYGLEDEYLDLLKEMRKNEIEIPDIPVPPIGPIITDPPFPIEIEEVISEQEIEIPYDEESSYFFMYGINKSGKTAILTGLFLNLYSESKREGDTIKRLNDNSIEYQKKGTILIEELLQINKESGIFPKGTPSLASESSIIPRQMNFEFEPKDTTKPTFKFTMMDFSGEDLMNLKIKSESDKGKLPQGIETFLQLPHNNLAFICVYPIDVLNQYSELSSYMLSFFDELDRIGHTKTPLLFVVSKWDLVQDKYESIEDFLKDKSPIIWNKINESQRKIDRLKFSIGDVDPTNNSFNYDPKNSNELFQWMYKTQMGVDLDEKLATSSKFRRFMEKLIGRNK
jgi:hypothetical protein